MVVEWLFPKSNRTLPSDPAPPLLGMDLELEAGVQTKAGTQVF